ncbi:MAG: hypothetical protein Kow0056_06990 [Coriobacteriia bacterium]
MNYVIASNRQWHRAMVERLNLSQEGVFYWIDSPEDLSVAAMRRIDPRYIFFPHWSHIIPEEIHSQWECVIFHMTDVPFGRGGSPLRNLIVRGIYETKLSALRCISELDAGPVYAKRDLCLHGSAEEVYLRASAIAEEMIAWIVAEEPEPVPQVGEPVVFERRRPEQSRIENMDLIRVFDHIRMLDADGYPAAFIEIDGLRIEFTRATLRSGKVVAQAEITEMDRKDSNR